MYPETPDPTRPLETTDETTDQTTDQTMDRTAVLTEDQATAPAEPDTPEAALPPSPINEVTEPKRPMRMRTVILGLILLVIAGAVLVAQLTDLSVDPGAVVLALMIGAGLLLIAGARRN